MMGLKIRIEVVANAECDRCSETLEFRAPSKKAAAKGIYGQRWSIYRPRRKTALAPDPATEAICPDCVKKEADEKQAKKAALAAIAADKKAAIEKARAERAALLEGEEPKEGDSNVGSEDVHA